jgi:hypothetical protein
MINTYALEKEAKTVYLFEAPGLLNIDSEIAQLLCHTVRLLLQTLQFPLLVSAIWTTKYSE